MAAIDRVAAYQGWPAVKRGSTVDLELNAHTLRLT